MGTKNIGGPLRWQDLYARSNPKMAAEKIEKVHECRRLGFDVHKIALIANLSLDEVKKIMGVS